MKDYLMSLKFEEGQTQLTDEQIKGIIAKSGEIVNTEVGKVTTSKAQEIQGYKDTISNLEKQIEELPKNEDLDKLKNEIQAFKDAETQRLADEKKAKEESIRQERTNAFFSDVKFASESAKAGVIAQFNAKDFKYDEETNKFLGGKEFLEDLKTKDPGAFLSDVANPTFTTNVTAPTSDATADELREAMGLSSDKK